MNETQGKGPAHQPHTPKWSPAWISAGYIFQASFVFYKILLWGLDASKAGQKHDWEPESLEKRFSDALIDSLMPSTPHSQQAPIFRTDGKVMICSHN